MVGSLALLGDAAGPQHVTVPGYGLDGNAGTGTPDRKWSVVTMDVGAADEEDAEP